MIVDGDGMVSAANPAWAILGHEPAALVGRPLRHLTHPDSVEALGPWLESPDAPLRVELRSSAGAFRPFTLRGARIEEGLAVIARELRVEDDEARASARRFRSLWEALSGCLADFVVTSDDTGSVQTLNRDPPGIPPEALIGQPESMFTPIAPSERPALVERFHRVLATGELISYETRVEYPDGTIGTFESRLGPVRDDAAIIGTVLVTRDITAQRQAEAARAVAERSLHEYMTQLERSNRELERFASVASHDLQEPLRKIQAFSERLVAKFAAELPEAGRDYIARMQDAARRMQDLINDLLMFSRISMKDQRMVPVDLTKVVSVVVSDLEVRIEETEGAVEVGPMPVIDGDPVHMRQLFQNLIANALKFRRNEVAPVVKISATPSTLNGRPSTRIVVADNGIGIEPRYRDRIFGIFERLHGRGKYEGTGVGLAVCRKICEQHGGAISVDSVPGEGSSFILEIPLKAEKKQAGA
ncbi:MAG: ATP-binding protein [Nannocystaceae bacterium]